MTIRFAGWSSFLCNIYNIRYCTEVSNNYACYTQLMSFEEPEDIPEKIELSAVRFRGEVFTGKTHVDALKELGKRYPDWEAIRELLEGGFITTTGRYVDRDEAGKIAMNAGQLA